MFYLTLQSIILQEGVGSIAPLDYTTGRLMDSWTIGLLDYLLDCGLMLQPH